MNYFLKKIKYLGLALLIKPLNVWAAYDFKTESGLESTANHAGYFASLKSLDPESLIILIVNYLLGIIGVIFLVLIITAGLKWMTAEGNEEQLKKAKQSLIQSLIGIAVVFLAYLISYFVIYFLTETVLS